MEINMKMKTFGVALLALILSAVPLSAQTFLTTTTLTSAVTSTTQTTFVVLSATTIEVGGMLYLDREAVQVTSVSGLNIGVARGQLGTKANTHAAGTLANGGAVVVIVPKAAQAGSGPYGLAAIGQVDPPPGSCTTASYRYLPIINAVTGDIWSCRWVGSGTNTSKVWASTNIVMTNGQTSLIVQ